MTAPTSTHRRNHQARRRPIRRMAARLLTPAADRRVALATIDTLCDEASIGRAEAVTRLGRNSNEATEWHRRWLWLSGKRTEMKEGK